MHYIILNKECHYTQFINLFYINYLYSDLLKDIIKFD